MIVHTDQQPCRRRQARFTCAGAFAFLASALMVAACGAPPTPVAFSNAWPDSPGEYRQTHQEWTRNGVLRTLDQEILNVHATFKSPAWRAAHVARRAETHKLSTTSQQTLRDEQSKAAADVHEVHLLVTTGERRENDLQKGEDSIWRVALRDDQGAEVTPSSIVKDKRPVDVIRAEYPDMGDFATAYIVRFPRTLEVMRPGAKQFSLTVASPRGGVELIWQAR